VLLLYSIQAQHKCAKPNLDNSSKAMKMALTVNEITKVSSFNNTLASIFSKVKDEDSSQFPLHALKMSSAWNINDSGVSVTIERGLLEYVREK